MRLRTVCTILVAMFALCLIGCVDKTDNSADAQAAAQTRDLLSEAMKQLGLPRIKNFQELRTAKLILEQCDRTDLVCYAYRENWQGDLIFFGKCMGYGLPYSVNYTNPEVPAARFVWPTQKLAQTQNETHRKTWGTDGGGIGGAVALRSGTFVMNKSGGSKRVLNALKGL